MAKDDHRESRCYFVGDISIAFNAINFQSLKFKRSLKNLHIELNSQNINELDISHKNNLRKELFKILRDFREEYLKMIAIRVLPNFLEIFQ